MNFNSTWWQIRNIVFWCHAVINLHLRGNTKTYDTWSDIQLDFIHLFAYIHATFGQDIQLDFIHLFVYIHATFGHIFASNTQWVAPVIRERCPGLQLGHLCMANRPTSLVACWQGEETPSSTCLVPIHLYKCPQDKNHSQQFTNKPYVKSKYIIIWNFVVFQHGKPGRSVIIMSMWFVCIIYQVGDMITTMPYSHAWPFTFFSCSAAHCNSLPFFCLQSATTLRNIVQFKKIKWIASLD